MFPSFSLEDTSRRQALELASIIAAHEDVEAITLFGSVARGDSDATSDIDVLVLGDNRLKASRLHELVSEHPAAARFAPSLWTWERLERRAEYGSLFLLHVNAEGHVLFDPNKRLQKALYAASREITFERELYEVERRLKAYSDPERFGRSFLFPLAHLYILAKRTAMIGVAVRGSFEFRHKLVFARFGDLYPVASSAAQTAARLRPFYARTKELPALDFPFRTDDVEPFERAMHSVREMVDLVASQAR